MVYELIPIIIGVAIGVAGIRIVRPTERGLVERLGKYNRFANQGFHWIVPVVDQMIKVNITEQMVDAKRQDIITSDNLNAGVDAQIYFRVNETEDDVKKSQYKVNNYYVQIVNLARTTLRNIVGNMTLSKANSDRNSVNKELFNALSKETKNWGIAIVRTEPKEIEPPKDVQEAMNQVVVAENEKRAATDFATATETKADGEKRADIKRAEGRATAVKVGAIAKAEAIKVVNKATEETFKEKAQMLRKLEAVEKALSENAKIVIPQGESLVNVIGEAAGIIPVTRKEKGGN